MIDWPSFVDGVLLGGFWAICLFIFFKIRDLQRRKKRIMELVKAERHFIRESA